MDHRKYIGGHWDLAGKLQFEFLKEEGLKPYHSILEVGCGSCRASRYFIEYLDRDKYVGLDHHQWLIDAALEKELTPEIISVKKPVFIVNNNFDFNSVKRTYDYAIAKSVFTHLTKDEIVKCLTNIKDRLSTDASFYASVFIGDSSDNLEESHDNKRFSYSMEEIKEMAKGWNVSNLGHRGCFKQIMLKFTPIRDDLKVTIVTAGYRGENMDKVCESINSQTFKDWEWVIINDGQESVREWYKGFDNQLYPQIYFVDIQKPMGRFGLYSRNVGAMLAKYNRIVFLDDDNEWAPDHLESMIKAEQETGKIPYCWMHIKGKKEGSTHDRIKKTHFGRQGIDLGCFLYRKEHFIKYGYFEDSRQVTYDFDFFNKIVQGEGKDNFICTKNASFVFWHRRY